MKIKAFIFTGTRHQYEYFLRDNHLDRREYPQLQESNWLGVRDAQIIKVGTFFENEYLLDKLPHIENYLNRNTRLTDTGEK